MSHSTPQFKCLAFLAAAIAPLTLMTGCGVGPTAATDTVVAGLHGVAHGGVNPVINSTVTLYATSNGPYGTGGTQLAQTTTDANGAFVFTGAATCPAGQQAYVTASQGNTGGNTNNPNVLLMAALGPCEGISTSTNIMMSEVSTVAAGYALSNFMSIDADGVTVHVSAPATNNSPSPFCSGTGANQLCFAAGLAHAFLNAANLVNASSNTGSATGATYTTTPGNSNSVVPTLLINTLGNILQACVNSTGGVASNTSTPCGSLFANTTPPTTSVAAPVTPTNTLQAVLNLAKYPSMTPAQVTALYALSSPESFFVPALAAAPSDYSLAVVYHGPSAAVNYVYGFYSTTDITDTIYTLSETGNGSGAVTLNQISSNGANGNAAASPTITGALCTAGSPCAAATDTLGNLWLANTNGTNLNAYQISTSTGAVLNTYAFPSGIAPNSAAVDKFNNVFVTSANITANDLFEKAPSDPGFTAVTANGVAETQTVASPEYVAISPDGSVWNTNYNGSNVTVTYNQNTATPATPVFANSPVTAQLSSTVNSPYTIMFDSTGNAWVNSVTSLFEVAPGATSPTTALLISATGGNATATNPKVAASARFSALDGDGNIFLPENNTAGVVFQYFPGTGNFIYLSPCTGNSGTACTTSGLKVASPRNAIMDSTGSIWVTDPSATVANGNLVQVIGTGAPTWPQLSYGRPGVRP